MNTNKTDLPKEILRTVNTLDVNVLEIFLYNDRKKSATLLVEDKKSNEKLILKCISEETPELEKFRFKNEITYYTEYLGPKLSPKYVDSGSKYLLLEYINSVTLRKKISRYLNHNLTSKEKKELLLNLESYISQVLEHYREVFQFPVEEEFVPIVEGVDNLFSIYSKLATSGPFSTKRTKCAELASKLFFVLTKKIVKRKLFTILQNNNELLKSGFTHQDFHLDNLLVDNNSDRIRVIDFANYQKSGLIIHDLVYHISTMLTLLEPRKEIKETYMRLLIGKLNLLPVSFRKILDIAVIIGQIGKTNSRFNSEASLVSIFKSYVYFFQICYLNNLRLFNGWNRFYKKIKTKFI